MPTAIIEGLATITFTLNGRRRTVHTHPMKRLLDVLREDCGHTGTKEGCGEGECGACTVLMNGISVNSCLVPVVHADGAKVLTIEGLAGGRTLSVLQQAFVDLGGAQCGICTPGMLLSAHELITRSPGRVPGDQEVRDALAGNLCRCTGYQKIVDAVRSAARGASVATRKRPAKSGPVRKAAGRKGTVKKTALKKAAVRKTAVGKAAAKKAAKTAAVKKATARRAAPKKSAMPKKRATPKKSAAQKKRATPRKRASPKKRAARSPASKRARSRVTRRAVTGRPAARRGR